MPVCFRVSESVRRAGQRFWPEHSQRCSVRTSQAPKNNGANGRERRSKTSGPDQWRSATTVAAASLATKAKRKSAAPVPSNGFGDLSLARMDDLASGDRKGEWAPAK